MYKEKMKKENEKKVNIVIRLHEFEKMKNSIDVLDRLIDMNAENFSEETMKETKDYSYISCLSMDLDELINVKDFLNSILR